MSRSFTCPEEALAGEIEFALVYVRACNPDRIQIAFNRADVSMLAAAVAKMLAERAESGLSGMRLEDTGRAEVPG